MQASKFGYLLLATVAFATPACFTVDKDDDGDAGEGGASGDESGGSSGKGGSSSGSGGSTGGSSSGSGGSTSGSGGSVSGNGGSSGSAECNLSGYELPELPCPAGSVTYLDDPTCLDYLSCVVIADCSAAGSDCAACITYNEDAAGSVFTCSEGTTAGFAAACAGVSQMAENAAAYPECVVSQ